MGRGLGSLLLHLGSLLAYFYTKSFSPLGIFLLNACCSWIQSSNHRNNGKLPASDIDWGLVWKYHIGSQLRNDAIRNATCAIIKHSDVDKNILRDVTWKPNADEVTAEEAMPISNNEKLVGRLRRLNLYDFTSMANQVLYQCGIHIAPLFFNFRLKILGTVNYRRAKECIRG